MHIKRRRTALALGPALAAAVVVTGLLVAPWAAAEHVTPTTVPGNPSCADVGDGDLTELKVQPVAEGSYSDGTLTVTLSNVNKTFDWEANQPVQVVIVKGGPNANVYDYGSPGATSDTELRAPDTKKSGPAGLSHVSFCYEPADKPPPTTTDPKPTETTTDPKPTETTTPTTTTPPPADGRCTGFAFDLRLDVAGIVSGFVGPVVSTEPDVFPDRETFSDLQVVFPLTGATEPVVTARTLDAENSGNPQDGCTTRVTYEDAVVDLNNITPDQGLPVVLTAKVLETTATATLLEDGTIEKSTSVTIIGGSLSIDGEGGALPEGQVPPNSGFSNEPECFASPDGVGQLCVTVMLHETELIPGGIAANAVRLKVSLETPLPPTSSQIVDLKLAHAEADVHAE